jgi:ADP-heptose:LPS heptosyltransferase
VTTSIGPLHPRFADVRRIAVVRGGGLGDLVFALPALRALRTAYPDAEMVLLGTPAHDTLLAGRPGPVDRVVPLPVARGVFEPGTPQDDAALERFFDRMAAERFDLAVQAHGGGRWSNPFTRRLGARHTIGTRTPDAEPLERWLPYRYHQHEALRWLEVAGLGGATGDIRARIAVTGHDLAAAGEALAGLPRPIATLHPGATDPRRRWPAARFAEVAGKLAACGAGVAVVGTPDEADVVARVANGHPGVRPLVGVLGLAGLVGVLAASAVVVANDSGPRHLAEAVGTPTVSVFWCGNMINAGPFGRTDHRVQVGWTVRCPACGADLTTRAGCGHDDSWVADVPARDVTAETLDLLARADPPQP